MKVVVYDKGVRLSSDRPRLNSKLPSSPRGKVVKFSRSSRRRLREFLVSRHIPFTCIYGVCLTIPKQVDIKLAVARFPLAVQRLRVYFLRRFPSSGFVWRVELQKNRMPHLHLVCFLPVGVDASSFFVHLWSDCVRGLFEIPSYSAFLLHGTKCEILDMNINAFRYLCDHGSKRKQAQLGYKGRQWGVVGRENFVFRDSFSFDLSDHYEKRFTRFLRRLSAFSVPYDKHGCPFGRKLVKTRNQRAVCYVHHTSVERWLDYHGFNECPF